MKSTTNHNQGIKPRACLSAVVLTLLLGSLFLILELQRAATGSTLPALAGEAALTHLKEQGLSDSLEAALAAARYRVRPTEGSRQAGASGAYYAANAAQHLTAHFTPQELALAPSRRPPPASGRCPNGGWG